MPQYFRLPNVVVFAGRRGDPRVGSLRIQSALKLRRVHAEGVQRDRRRICWLEREDLGQHPLGCDLELAGLGFDAPARTFIASGDLRKQSICAVSLIPGIFLTPRNVASDVAVLPAGQLTASR
jgi:hypothetical protein